MQVYGIDLSKEKFDVNFIDATGKQKDKQVKNAISSIAKFLVQVPEDGVLCAEHTGVYGDLLVYLCNDNNLIFCYRKFNIKYRSILSFRLKPNFSSGFNNYALNY